MASTLRILSIFLLCWASHLSAEFVEKMTLEEKAGQLLMVHFHGETANGEAETLICDTKVGGIVYYNWSNGLNSPAQVKNLSSGLQELAENNRLSIPLFIGVDQEGGRVARLKNGFTVFPANQTLGETGNPDLAQAAAFTMGRELRAVGININFAPVVDVNINPRNPVIGSRSFSNDPKIVLAFSEKALAGYKQANIIASLKHFPGHGDVEMDSHLALPVVDKPMSELERAELFPFAKLASSADLIMTAHLLVPALDPQNCSTLSKKTLSYLRNTLGFEGVIITDSLVMEGVLKKCRSIDEAAIQALDAGCDILLLGGKQLIGGTTNLELTAKDIQRVHRSIVNAVKNGRLSEARVDEAVRKILSLKKRYLYPSGISRLGERIWKNECAGTIEGLTCWNKRENFASLGIGHFIWYPVGRKERFEETFPDLLQFLQKKGAILPEWLKRAEGCPWSTREEFYANIQNPQMRDLRQFLFETRDLQAVFIAERLKKTFSLMLDHCPPSGRGQVETIFTRLSNDANGLYAMVDYLNFKGSGVSAAESYKNQHWGLLQVLQSIPLSSEQPLVDFIAAAKSLLKRRVDNSPAERDEKQWLTGWFNRLDGYLIPL